MKLPRFRLKKIQKNPDSGKKPDSKIFRIFSKMDSLRYFVIIKCFSFFEIPIFKTTVAILLFGGKTLKLSNGICRKMPLSLD